MRPTHRRARRALILLAVILQCGLLLVLGISLLSMSTADARLLAARADGASALELAQAGVTRAAWILAQRGGLSGWNQDGQAFPLAPGAYSVTIRPDPADSTLFQVTATGGLPDLQAPRLKRSVEVLLRKEPVLAFAAFAGSGGMAVSGQVAATGDVYCGGELALRRSGASLHVTGDILAGGPVDEPVQADGRIRQARATRSLPVVDTALLQGQARSQGTLFATREEFLAALQAGGHHVRGTWFVADAGPLQVTSLVDLRGTLVLSGPATFSRGLTHHGDGSQPALVGLSPQAITVEGLKTHGNGPTVIVATGPLLLSGDVDVRGAVYASSLAAEDRARLSWHPDLATVVPQGLSQPVGEGVRVMQWHEQ